MDCSNSYGGHFPKCMPVGMAYVPMQQTERIYVDEMALQRGTIYPELDLPFKGYENTEPLPQTPLTEVMQCDFVNFDLGLYLDTHPCDENVRMFYNRRLAQSGEAHRNYAEKCGPLTKSESWRDGSGWISGPWPWEYCEGGEC